MDSSLLYKNVDIDQFDRLCIYVDIKDLVTLYSQILDCALSDILVLMDKNDISAINAILHRVLGSTRTLHLITIENNLKSLSAFVNTNNKIAVVNKVAYIQQLFSILFPLIIQYIKENEC